MELEVLGLGTVSIVLATALVVLWRRLRRSERELAAAEEWEHLCAQLDVGIGFCDENLNLRRANPAFLGMFVNSQRRVKPRGGAMAIDEWLGERGAGHPLQDIMLRTLSGTPNVSGHVRLDSGDNCLVRAHRVHLNNGRLLLTLVAGRPRGRAEAGDLTMVSGGLDNAETRTLDERRGERRKKERLKDATILRIAHDLRNPLNAAMGWLHLIETDKVPQAEIGGAVRRIHNSILRQDSLIDELRKLADPVPQIARAASADRSMKR